MRSRSFNSLIYRVLVHISTQTFRAPKLILIALITLITSCTHKDLCFDHSHVVEVDVNFIWSKARNADPASMSVYLFHAKGGQPLRFEFTDINGGRIRLQVGHYKAICLNSDTRNIKVDDILNFESFYITTKTATALSGLSSFGIFANEIPKAKNTETERVVLSPEMLWSDSVQDIHIYEPDQTITFTPEQKITNYTVEITNVENLKWINGISGTISTMSGGYLPGLYSLAEENVTIPFEALMDREKAEITGAFTSFGHCPTINQTHKLRIYGLLTDNSKWYYEYDVTDQIHNSEDPYNIDIKLDGLPFPKPVANGGGFKPDVGDWNSVEITIKM